MNNPRNWSDDEIRDYFDSEPNLRMSQLARMTGKSTSELKRILMPGRRASTQISDDDFDRKYDPIDPPSGETYWEAHEIRDQKKNHIWTVLDADDGMFVVPGIHRVNQFGFMVTQKPWRNKNIEVKWASSGAASAKRVASQYKGAYREERGMGGLLFRFDRDGLNIRTMPSDPPYNQTYSNTITLSSSGKMAKRNMATVWADYKREIMAMKSSYKVTDFIDDKLREMGTRGRIKWHTKHYPD